MSEKRIAELLASLAGDVVRMQDHHKHSKIGKCEYCRIALNLSFIAGFLSMEIKA
jgi:hypothetical protein